jgi:hypothetical protein
MIHFYVDIYFVLNGVLFSRFMSGVEVALPKPPQVLLPVLNPVNIASSAPKVTIKQQITHICNFIKDKTDTVTASDILAHPVPVLLSIHMIIMLIVDPENV